jgi:hypothetical protein
MVEEGKSVLLRVEIRALFCWGLRGRICLETSGEDGVFVNIFFLERRLGED